MKIIFTTGDINGIGIEVLFKALLNNESWFDSHCFSIMGNNIVLKHIIDKNYNKFAKVNNDEIILKSGHKIKIIEIKHTDVLKIGKQIRQQELDLEIGQISKDAGIVAYHSIVEATKLTISKEFNAIVTLPISKKAIHFYDKDFIGHTELITKLCSKKNSIMILFTDRLRVALATIHTPIFKISRQITAKRLRTLCKKFNSTLKNDFGIQNPKIAMLGLNPHSSDNGMFGTEENQIINPTIDVMQKKRIDIEGAFAADGFFASKSYEKYDGVIAMYHDQGLIPLKMLGNGGGVNFTANLPIVRTSPDHGTAFEIAGKNIANEQSITNSINSAITILQNRKQ
jgi:4-hydroxythreonine-4-phosphate dehydrogenase